MFDSQPAILVVDLDNTTFDYDRGLAEHMVRTTGQGPSGPPEFYDYARSGWFPTNQDWLAAHSAAVMEGLFARMWPYDGALEGLASLREDGFVVKFATARGSRSWMPGPDGDELARVERETTAAGLRMLGVEYDELHFVASKAEVAGDLHIDDSPSHLADLDARGLPRIAYDQAYNRHLPGLRATNWDELGSVIRARLGA
ncbi:hypothetical protein ACFWGN_11970 [Oerskovia sp. NPDC060338]|uniref:5' nucleotidase, NT5C type n=1 Tax=Oerskovia sp. NPDC060338 TaxID=3347100 RepID=UPI00366920F8